MSRPGAVRWSEGQVKITLSLFTLNLIPGRVHQQLQHVRAVGEPGRPAAAGVSGQGTRSQVRTAQAPEGHRQDRRGS